MVAQCGLATVIGCIVFVALTPDPNPNVPLFGALICGIGGSWLLTFGYVWLRYGWKAARSMRWDQ